MKNSPDLAVLVKGSAGAYTKLPIGIARANGRHAMERFPKGRDIFLEPHAARAVTSSAASLLAGLPSALWETGEPSAVGVALH